MTFSKKKEVEFQESFPEIDLVKLQPRKDLPKVSRAERRKRQKEREAELENVLTLKQAGKIDADEIMKVASEGGEIQAVDVSRKDQRRLARLKSKASQQSTPAPEVAQAIQVAEAG